ncbi:2-carboxy-1,4-naphthoquinone phytyltransferase, chloroplastic [Malus sylvestris]|uniref:2-carboxy-1,4-naphthoquinone phytyltransferase, chloroplastic n=1 Tax=Malus sylvestris TaxID=3752 RepID=UPI0021ABE707|nr:2-carboxy-1,4-naphthoquinone phytyltransferase, chloroplastic [Malus sylvestris]
MIRFMATTFCYLPTGSGLTKLNDYRVSKRPYRRFETLSCFFCNPQKVFPRREVEVRRQWQHCGQAFVNNKSDYYSNTTIHQEEDKEADISKATLTWRAIKLPIYSVALIPLTVGSAAAYLQTGMFSAQRYSILLISSVLIITWLNLSNDVYDFDTGADINKKESVVNLVGSRTGTLVSAYLLLALGFLGLAWVSVKAGSMRAILLLGCAVTCGYIYQCPPFRLSYKGLGEPLCFAAFGPFATTGFYLLQGSTREVIHLPFTGSILSLSLLVGITTALILFCSHFHQIEGDRAVGKISPLVRLGTERGSGVVKWAVTGLYVLTFTFGLSSALPFTCIFLCCLTLPIARLVVSYVEENHNDKQKIFMAKYYCVRLHSLFGTALAAGLVVSRMFPKLSLSSTFGLS